MQLILNVLQHGQGLVCELCIRERGVSPAMKDCISKPISAGLLFEKICELTNNVKSNDKNRIVC